ncbi:MAG: type I polyketide synthase [Gemmatimonadota bacterium]
MSDQKDLLRRSLDAIDDLQARLAQSREPIAVTGMSCRFPGGVRTPDEYWGLLRDGRSGIVDIPSERWDVDAFYDPDLAIPGTMFTRLGGFVDGIDRFDAPFFRISPREAATLDPQQRLLLECTWEALEDAGEAPDGLLNSTTGVYVGITTSDYARLLRVGREDSDVYSATGTALNAAAGRLAFFLGLQGPCMAIDTACSSSLVAAHTACQALRAGECERAIVGGVNVMVSPEPFALFSRWGMISSSGECRAFDEGASGFVRGEGCGVLVLKRLSDAQAAGDPIHAVIRGSAVNQDGPSSGLSVPNGPAQVKVIRAALDRAGVRPDEVHFVEAHGTGTPLGDPIEVEALAEVYGQGRDPGAALRIGSVKPSIGHLESAAGVAGLMKLVLSIREAELPPQRSFRTPNPIIDWDRIPIDVVAERVPWTGEDRIGAVSSFGFSGTNAHIIVAAAPSSAPQESRSEAWRVLPISGHSDEAVRDIAAGLADRLENTPGLPLADVERTLMEGRAHFSRRAVAAVEDSAGAVHAFRSIAEGTDAPRTVVGGASIDPKQGTVLLFSGQGSQYPGMGLELYEAFPTFRDAFDRCAAIAQGAGGPDLLELLRSGGDAVHRTEHTQPALFAVEYALWALFDSWGITPTAVLGHSIGEFVAAHVAGVFSLEDAVRLVVRRGALMQALPAGGGLLAVAATREVAEAAAEGMPDVSLAAANGPMDVVLSGDLGALGSIAQTLGAQSVRTRHLEVSHAFHSPLMEPIQTEWADVLASATLSAPTLPLVSNLGGRLDPQAGSTVEYWVRHVREPVSFAASMQTLVHAGHARFLEVGPRPVLLGMARRFLDDDAIAWIPTLRARSGEVPDVLEGLGGLYCSGVDLDWSRLATSTSRRLRLPTYPFQRKRYWAARAPEPPGHAVVSVGTTHAGGHPLLGAAAHSPLPARTFVCTVDPVHRPVLAEHKVSGHTVFPAAGHIELAVAAARSAFGAESVRVADLGLHSALMLDSEDGQAGPEVQVVLEPTGAASGSFSVHSRSVADERGAWTLHAQARVEGLSGSPTAGPFEEAASRCSDSVDLTAYYASVDEFGLDYGPTFQALSDAWSGEGEAVGTVALQEGEPADAYAIHPALLDGAFHLIGLTGSADSDGRFLLPVGVDSVEVHGFAGPRVRAHCVIRESTADSGVVDLVLANEDGSFVMRVDGLRTRAMTREAFAQVVRNREPSPALRVAWQTLPEPARPDTAQPWLILAHSEATADLVRSHLTGDVAMATTDCATAAVDALSAGRGVIDLRACESTGATDVSPWLRDAGSVPRNALGLLRAVATGAATSSAPLVVATRAAQRVDTGEGVDPGAASVWGLGAVGAAELPGLDLRMIDVGDLERDAERLAWSAEAGTERRLAIREERTVASRLERVSPSTAVPSGPYQLDSGSPGDLSGLRLISAAASRPGPGEVLIEVLASGLNFRDVLFALDMYPGEPAPLGNECCGRIVEVGEGIDDFAVGDLVACIAEGTFGSHVVAETALTFAVPAELSIAQAAAFPIAQLTAYLALHHIGGMTAGRRVLVHAGAGGVGLAAVHLALAAGARVFATAGSDEKRALLRSLGVEEVWNSREPVPADVVREATGGGVDLLLNSLTGEMIDEGLDALADGGHFLEIGLRDIRDTADLATSHPGLSYSTMVLGEWCREQPELVRSMWDKLAASLKGGHLPAPKVRRFPIGRVEDAFRFMARARHIGRVVVEHAGARATVRDDATYVVTGGLGALGLHTAEWLADQGARHIALFGRSEPKAEARDTLARLEARGVSVRRHAVDVGEVDQVEALEVAGPPIRGVVHAAGVTEDSMLPGQTDEVFDRVARPKVAGVRSILSAFPPTHLDFLALYSSGSAVLGATGQAAYAGANAYLDGTAHALDHAGFPALSVSWGAWDGGGMAAAVDEATLERWAEHGIGKLAPEQALGVLGDALHTGTAHIAALPIDWPRFLRASGSTPAFLERLDVARAAGDSDDFVASDVGQRAKILRELPAPDRLDALKRDLAVDVAAVLGMSEPSELVAERGFTEQGMDSLMAVELGSRLSKQYDVTLHSTFVFEHPTLQSLASHLLGVIIEDEVVPEGPADATEVESDGELEEMSEDELQAELLRELDEVEY